MSLWCQLYAPKDLNDFNTNKDSFPSITSWITTIKTSKKCKPLFIIGPIGSGKTLLARLILKKYNYDIHEFNSTDVRTQKNIKSSLENIICCKPLFNNKEFSIIIDEIESIVNDRGGLTQIQTMVNPKNNKNRVPIIITCGINEDKKFVDLVRNCEVINLKRPNSYELRNIINDICIKSNSIIDEYTIINIIKESDCDIRKCINYIEDVVKSIKYNEKINEDVHDSSKNSLSDIKSCLYGKKDNINISNYDIVYKIFNDNKPDTELIRLDQMIIPMIAHENYITHIYNNYGDVNKNKIKIMTEIADMFSYTNILDKYILTNNMWNLLNISTTIKSINLNGNMNKLKSKKSFNNCKLIFTRLLTNSSNSCNNNKFTKYIADKFNINYYNVNYLNYYIVTLINNQNTYKIKDIINYYNLLDNDLIKIYKFINEEEDKKDRKKDQEIKKAKKEAKDNKKNDEEIVLDLDLDSKEKKITKLDILNYIKSLFDN
jgi:hypothetical protein